MIYHSLNPRTRNITKLQQHFIFHDWYFCPGLKRCKVEMKVITTEEARAMGRKQCGWCYTTLLFD
jgi:hypothetical protein